MKIIIGTRGSKLSLTQTNLIRDSLLAINPELQIEIIIITTKGDTNMSPIPLDIVGKGWFTKELDKALLLDTIDIAVHSLKDLPVTLPKGLHIVGIPKREDARDVFVSRDNIRLENIKPKAIIGTDSIRRKIQILQKRPDLIIKSIRGNVNTRLSKLIAQEYDGILLAAAGLNRLDLQAKITQYFDPTDIIPSPGQGALAIVAKKDNTEVCTLVSKLNHRPTTIATQAERAFSKAIGGGCKTPTGAYAICTDTSVTLYGMIGSLDGSHMVKESMQGSIMGHIGLGKKLAERLLDVSKD